MTNRARINLLKRIWKVVKPYFVSEEKLGAWTLLGLNVLCGLVMAIIIPIFGAKTGEITSSLVAKDVPRLINAIVIFILALGIFSIASSGVNFFIAKLALYWRQWLTLKVLGKYFRDRSYYQISSIPEIDNPDQRIAEDIYILTSGISVVITFLSISPPLIIGSSIALGSLSPILVAILLIYYGITTGVSIGWFAKTLLRLNFQQFKKEANFRFSLARVRDNAESIAFYQGEARESQETEQKFDQVFNNKNKIVRWQNIYLAGFNILFNNLPILLPILVLSNGVLSGTLEVGVIVTARSYANGIGAGMSLFSQILAPLTQLTASIERVEALVWELEQLEIVSKGKTGIDTREENALATSNLSLETPNYPRTLFCDLSFSVPSGNGLLVMGESGIGKSSLLRAIAGLWKTGTGLIIRPNLSEILFLPQRPYMILGTLRDQLLYPHTSPEISDEQLQKALQSVNLADLADRVGGFDVEVDFASMLSLGEQQRLAFARLLLTKPPYAILDESTSALDMHNEARLYQQLKDSHTTYISVGHRPSLTKYHQQVLTIRQDGLSEVRSIEDQG